jgi:hypothetical protein
MVDKEAVEWAADDDLRLASLHQSSHDMETTRMSSDPRKSVVNANYLDLAPEEADAARLRQLLHLPAEVSALALPGMGAGQADGRKAVGYA